MGMSCLEMPLVMGHSRVPEPPARMIPRMREWSSLLVVQRSVEGARRVPGGKQPALLRLQEAGGVGVLGGQEQVVGRERELEGDVAVQRVDPVLTSGIVDV